MSQAEAAVEMPAVEIPAAPVRPETAPRPPIQVDESKLSAMYANFCRVTGTPEELIIDFGLNAQPLGAGDAPVAVDSRVVTNYYTAKRLLHALQMTIKRHEAAFGMLETDVQKRVVRRD